MNDNHSFSATVSLRQILSLKEFDNYKICAGEAGIDNVVSRVTISEIPDALEWIIGGELVLTTGYVWKDSTDVQIKWITQAIQKGVSAVVVKPDRYIGKVPEAMCEIANRHNLPIVALPYDVVWPSLIHAVMNQLLAQQTRLLEETYSIHQELEKLVLNSAGYQELLKAISGIIHCSTQVDDMYFNEISSFYVCTHDPSVIEELRTSKEKFLSDVAMIKEHRSPIFWAKNSPGNNNHISVPVAAGTQLFGWLTALNIDPEKKSFVQMTLEQGANALSLKFFSDISGLRSRAEKTNNIISLMLNGEGLSHEKLAYWGQVVGVNLNKPTSVIRLHSRPKLSGSAIQRIEDMLRSSDKDSLIAIDGSDITILFHPMSIVEANAILECVRFCEKLLKDFENDSYKLYWGIGECVMLSDTSQFRKSFYSANICMKKSTQTNEHITVYNGLGSGRLLALMRNNNDIIRLAEDLLAPLFEYEKNRNSDLIKTLYCYYNNRLNIAKTAKDLSIHVNTMKYRLSCIQEILNVDLSDFDNCCLYYYAMNIVNYARSDGLKT